MSLAEDMNKIALKSECHNEESIINDSYKEILEDIKNYAIKGNFVFRLTDCGKNKKYKQIVSDSSRRAKIMTLLKNDGFDSRHVTYTGGFADEEDIIVTW